ncbi:uncharacterized protein LOC120634082 [Pararge aegeria]|uniref:uncharacterized protein LOC120634082 n=1 Tax=Pararge aegeria TaxID=116150 RepID=UPI0019D2A0B0|nr:uncharacterized protein LOC120634082 [Pararge aegeria]
MEEQFSIVEDITDPSLMENILSRLDEIQLEDEEFMQILLSKQNEMVVTWDQPWYQMANCLTRPLDQSNCKETAMFRTDAICSDESKKIHKNWKKFQKNFDVPNKPICLARWKNKEKCRSPSTPEEFVRRFVISFLARGLERNLYQVHKHFLNRYGSLNKGKYLKYEENAMEVCLYHCPKNAVIYLSAVLSREPRGIYKRLWQMFNGKPERKKLKWTLQLATKFLKLLMEHSGETVVDNLKQKKFEKSVWLKLEGDIGQQYIYLQQFWQDELHVQLFVKADVKINKLRRKVFKTLRLYPYKVWTDIRWKEVAKHFADGFSHRFLYKICYFLVFKSINKLRTHPLEEVIIHGIEKSKLVPNKRLKTLVFNENKELEIIKYSNKMLY